MLNVGFIVQLFQSLHHIYTFVPPISLGAIHVYPFQGFFDLYRKIFNGIIKPRYPLSNSIKKSIKVILKRCSPDTIYRKEKTKVFAREVSVLLF